MLPAPIGILGIGYAGNGGESAYCPQRQYVTDLLSKAVVERPLRAKQAASVKNSVEASSP